MLTQILSLCPLGLAAKQNFNISREYIAVTEYVLPYEESYTHYISLVAEPSSPPQAPAFAKILL